MQENNWTYMGLYGLFAILCILCGMVAQTGLSFRSKLITLENFCKRYCSLEGGLVYYRNLALMWVPTGVKLTLLKDFVSHPPLFMPISSMRPSDDEIAISSDPLRYTLILYLTVVFCPLGKYKISSNLRYIMQH